jgi:hypothetical protein
VAATAKTDDKLAEKKQETTGPKEQKEQKEQAECLLCSS